MDLSKEVKQRKEFRDILFELARSQEELQDAHYRSDMYKRLEVLYDTSAPGGRFRHFYSDIFSVLTQIQQDPALGDINILGQNLAVIRNGYKAKNKSEDGRRTIDVSDSIRKLYDHVNLEIARILYSDAADRKISGEAAIEKLQSQMNVLQNDIKKAEEVRQEYYNLEKQMDILQINNRKIVKEVEAGYDSIEEKFIDVESKLDNSQKEYITILGIFAAVVLAFTGGIAFTTSVFNNIAETSAYRILILALVIGVVLVNILFGLFYYINKLVNGKQKLWPLIISNVVLIGLILATVTAWNNGWVEARDRRIKDYISTVPIQSNTEMDEPD